MKAGRKTDDNFSYLWGILLFGILLSASNERAKENEPILDYIKNICTESSRFKFGTVAKSGSCVASVIVA